MSADNWTICPRCRDKAGIYASEAERTFSEYYEFSGAENGEVVARYRGCCSVCGLSAQIDHSVAFYEPAASREGFVIYINRQPFPLAQAAIPGEQLHQLSGHGPDEDLWAEAEPEDYKVTSGEMIPLKGGERFYTTPKFINAGCPVSCRDMLARVWQQGRAPQRKGD